MASYYDYDPRQRSSRRNDSYTRPQEDSYLKPTSGASEPRRRVGEGQSGRYESQRSSSRYRYDSKDDYPPPLGPDTGRPPRRAPSRNRKRYSWPPQPSCEDEATSLAKEAGAQKLLKDVGKDKAVSRGRLNQEPIIEDVPELINKDERRFVLSTQETSNSRLPTPPTSEDERTRKANRKPSKLNMNFNKVSNTVPEASKRPASPYAFSKPTSSRKDELPIERFLSPDSMLSPPPTDSRARRRGDIGTRSQPASPIRDTTRRSPSSRTGSDYFSLSASENAIDDADADDRRPRTYPPSRDGAAPGQRTTVIDFAPQPQLNPQPIRKLNLDARRNTDTEGTLPTLPRLRAEKQRRPTPLVATNALSDLDSSAIYSSPTTTPSTAEFPRPRSRDSSYTPAYTNPPTGSIFGEPGSAASTKSNRLSAEFTCDQSTHSSPTSRHSSVSGSRPSSPSPRTPNDSPRLPRTELDWSALLAANAARRPKGPSRLTSLRQETVPAPSRPDPKQTSLRTESLPYPVEDGPSTPIAWMPSESTHAYYPDQKQALRIPAFQESKTLSRSASPVP